MSKLNSVVGVWLLALSLSAAETNVRTIRVPDGGIQPHALVDSQGTVHLVYYKGDPGKGDLYYVKSTDDGASFSKPLRVNTQAGSAVATGNIRGAQIALGKYDRLHVAWNCSQASKIAPPRREPMLYTRWDPQAGKFEPEKNVVNTHYVLDGGGAVAADQQGHVYVAWHAPEVDTTGEGNRRVWIARSDDEGATFAPEVAAFKEPTGACGCCGLNAMCDQNGNLFVLYRTATDVIHRDMYLLASPGGKLPMPGRKVSSWDVDHCVMSLAAFCEGDRRSLGAWEVNGQIQFNAVEVGNSNRRASMNAPGTGVNRRFPTLATNARGEILLAWTENMAWNRGGQLAWQLFDPAWKPIGKINRADGVPTWSLVSAFTDRNGNFVVVY